MGDGRSIMGSWVECILGDPGAATISDNTAETLRNEWELRLWKSLTTTNLPPINVALPPKTPWWFLIPSKQHWWRRGGGEEKHFCDLVGVSTQRNGEIRSLIAFVSTSFAQDCVKRVSAIVQKRYALLPEVLNHFLCGIHKSRFFKPLFGKINIDKNFTAKNKRAWFLLSLVGNNSYACNNIMGIVYKLPTQLERLHEWYFPLRINLFF